MKLLLLIIVSINLMIAIASSDAAPQSFTNEIPQPRGPFKRDLVVFNSPDFSYQYESGPRSTGAVKVMAAPLVRPTEDEEPYSDNNDSPQPQPQQMAAESPKLKMAFDNLVKKRQRITYNYKILEQETPEPPSRQFALPYVPKPYKRPSPPQPKVDYDSQKAVLAPHPSYPYSPSRSYHHQHKSYSPYNFHRAPHSPLATYPVTPLNPANYQPTLRPKPLFIFSKSGSGSAYLTPIPTVFIKRPQRPLSETGDGKKKKRRRKNKNKSKKGRKRPKQSSSSSSSSSSEEDKLVNGGFKPDDVLEPVVSPRTMAAPLKEDILASLTMDKEGGGKVTVTRVKAEKPTSMLELLMKEMEKKKKKKKGGKSMGDVEIDTRIGQEVDNDEKIVRMEKKVQESEEEEKGGNIVMEKKGKTSVEKKVEEEAPKKKLKLSSFTTRTSPSKKEANGMEANKMPKKQLVKKKAPRKSMFSTPNFKPKEMVMKKKSSSEEEASESDEDDYVDEHGDAMDVTMTFKSPGNNDYDDYNILDEQNIKYDYMYRVQGQHPHSRMESRTGQTLVGQYRVELPDGRIQVVDYTADETGYHPVISYEGSVTVVPKPEPQPQQPASRPSYGYNVEESSEETEETEESEEEESEEESDESKSISDSTSEEDEDEEEATNYFPA